jgi:hypothetical protein
MKLLGQDSLIVSYYSSSFCNYFSVFFHNNNSSSKTSLIKQSVSLKTSATLNSEDDHRPAQNNTNNKDISLFIVLCLTVCVFLNKTYIDKADTNKKSSITSSSINCCSNSKSSHLVDLLLRIDSSKIDLNKQPLLINSILH